MTDSSKHKITVIGSGYVGMSLAVLLSQKHSVEVVDIDEDKVKKINLGVSPISDSLISDYLENKALNLKATSSLQSAIPSTNHYYSLHINRILLLRRLFLTIKHTLNQPHQRRKCVTYV